MKMNDSNVCFDCDSPTMNSDCMCDNCKDKMIKGMVKTTSTGEPMSYLPSENASLEGSSE